MFSNTFLDEAGLARVWKRACDKFKAPWTISISEPVELEEGYWVATIYDPYSTDHTTYTAIENWKEGDLVRIEVNGLKSNEHQVTTLLAANSAGEDLKEITFASMRNGYPSPYFFPDKQYEPYWGIVESSSGYEVELLNVNQDLWFMCNTATSNPVKELKLSSGVFCLYNYDSYIHDMGIFFWVTFSQDVIVDDSTRFKIPGGLELSISNSSYLPKNKWIPFIFHDRTGLDCLLTSIPDSVIDNLA